MPIEVTMPALSPTMEEGTLAKWLVKEGDTVSAGDVIAEIETDKATMEVEAVDEGTVGKIVVDEGTEGVKVNAVIAVLLEEGEDADAIGSKPRRVTGGNGAGKAEEPEPAAEKAGGRGRSPKRGPTARPRPRPRRRRSGYGRGEAPEQGERPDAASRPRAKAEPKGKAARNKEGERIFASPLARRIAKERGVDLRPGERLRPQGPDCQGRHRRLRAGQGRTKAGAGGRQSRPPEGTKQPAMAATAAAPNAVPGFTTEQVRKIYEGRPFTEVTLDNMRKTIATRLSQAKATIPHFYLRRDIRLDTLLGVRKSFNDQLAASGTKLSVNDFVIKACAMALMRVKAGERSLGRRPHPAAGVGRCRRRRRHRGRAADARHPRRARQGAGADLVRDEGSGGARPRPQAAALRVPGRQLCHLEPRHVRHRELRCGHQPAARLHPGGLAPASRSR